MKLLCSVVLIYVIMGIATTVALTMWWAYERYTGGYEREEMPIPGEMFLFCGLFWPLAIGMAMAEIAGRLFPPRG